MRTRLVSFLALMVTLTGLLACGGPAVPEPTPIASPRGAATVAPDPTGQGYTPTFEKAPCAFQLPAGQVEGQTAECGYLVVPEDRHDPAGRTIRLAVAIFHPPGGAIEPEPIIYLVGGPGGSILEFLYLSFDRLFSRVLVAKRDIILFDQRGVGLSLPALDCTGARELSLELLDYELDGKQLTDEEVDDLLGQAYVACEEDLSAIADLSAYNTVASAADVNDLRLALGYEQVNLWGGSYGTRLALGVMRDYPEGLRCVVLDSAYPPDVNMYLEAPANLDRSLSVLFEACAADEACDAAFPDLRQVLFDTVERLEADPVDTVITNPLTRESYDALLTGNTLLGLVFQLLYETAALPELPQLIYDASRGNFDAINRIRGALLAQATVSSVGMSLSVQCNEELSFSSLGQYEAVLADYPELADYFRDSIVGEIAYHACLFWDSGQAAAIENEAVSSALPTLIMQGEYDPITPPAWGQHAAETLENAYFYVYPGVGHGASVADCPREMMIAFLQDPSKAPDDGCVAQMHGVSFIVPGAGVGAVEMEPFSSPEKGLQGVAPAGWTEAGPGTYTRGNSALDETALAMDAVSLRAEELFGLLAERLGFDPGLESVAREEVGRFTWDFYAFELQGLSMDLALAGEGERAYLVLLISVPDDRDTLYEQVFRPALEALAPLE